MYEIVKGQKIYYYARGLLFTPIKIYVNLGQTCPNMEFTPKLREAQSSILKLRLPLKKCSRYFLKLSSEITTLSKPGCLTLTKCDQ